MKSLLKILPAAGLLLALGMPANAQQKQAAPAARIPRPIRPDPRPVACFRRAACFNAPTNSNPSMPTNSKY